MLSEAMNQVPRLKVLLKMFLMPFLAGIAIGLISMGLSGFSPKIVTASLVSGAEFALTIAAFFFVNGPLRGANLIVLFAAVGSGSGVFWWAFVRPPWPLIIAVGIGGVLSGLWAYMEGEITERIFK
jgi:hypothetical protein